MTVGVTTVFKNSGYANTCLDFYRTTQPNNLTYLELVFQYITGLHLDIQPISQEF